MSYKALSRTNSSVEKLTKTTAKSEFEDPCEVEFMSACCKQVL